MIMARPGLRRIAYKSHRICSLSGRPDLDVDESLLETSATRRGLPHDLRSSAPKTSPGRRRGLYKLMAFGVARPSKRNLVGATEVFCPPVRRGVAGRKMLFRHRSLAAQTGQEN